MKKLIYIICFLCPLYSFAQFETDYTPIKYTGEVPAEFRENTAKKTKEDIRNEKGDLKRKGRKDFYTRANFSMNQLLLSGNIYFNDELTAYVNKVAGKLLENKPELKSKVKIYVSKSPIPNAYALSKGVIMINIGLLSRFESEAQLAFVLAHEISHITGQHSLLQYKREDELEKASKKLTFKKGNEVDKLFEELRYSREHEYEADRYGFQLLATSSYDIAEALTGLALLSKVDEHKYDTEVNWSFVEEVLANTTEKCVDKYLEEFEETLDDRPGEEWSSHPDIDKRIAALKEEQKSLTVKDKQEKYLVGKTEFDRIKLICDFELVEKYNSSMAYALSMIRATQLQQKFPDNKYLSGVIADNLYWLAFYKKQNGDEAVLEGAKRYDTNVLACVCQLQKVDNDVFMDKSLAYVKDLYEKFPKLEAVSMAYAQLVELEDGITAALPIYTEHIKRFPKGKHTAFAKIKKSSKS